MRASPENRALVYRALVTYRLDNVRAVSPQTLSMITGLSDEVVLACLDAMVAAGAVLLVAASQEHPLYAPAVLSLAQDAKAPPHPHNARAIDSDRTSGGSTNTPRSATGG